jgi:hypothetical protein
MLATIRSRAVRAKSRDAIRTERTEPLSVPRRREPGPAAAREPTWLAPHRRALSRSRANRPVDRITRPRPGLLHKGRIPARTSGFVGWAYFDPRAAILPPLSGPFRNGMRFRKFFLEYKPCAEIGPVANRARNKEMIAMLWIAGTSFAGVIASSTLLYLLF